MTASDNVAAVRDFVDRAWNGGDESVFQEHLAPDFAHPGGRDGFRATVFAFRAAFADFTLEVDDIFGAGDRVVTRFRISGTHQGEFMGAAPTGRRVEFGGIAVDVMRDGQRTEGWAQLDLLGLLNQLGALDRPGG